MSLNPFHRIRKHQRTLLAILTIFTMILFIFQFGPGDLFSGRGPGSGPGRAQAQERTAATINGQPIYKEDIEQLRLQRELANIFMVEILDRSHGNIIERIEIELLPTLKDDKEKALSTSVRRVVDTWRRAFRPDEKSRQNAFFDQFSYYRTLDQNIKMLQFFEGQLSAKDSRDKKELLQLLIGMMEQDKKLASIRLGQGDMSYFGGGNLNNLRDLLDFKIWLSEADRLGINLAGDTLTAMVRQEAQNQVAPSVLKETLGLMQRQRRFTNLSADALENALRDEFRVRLARLAVLGYEAAGANVPPAVTPYDLYQFFKENRTENSVALLPVPADRKDFLSAVPEAKEADLRAFYDKYKKREDDPGAREPGFKAPPKRMIEWVSARADSPFYKAEAKKERERAREATTAAMQIAAGQLSATGFTPAAGLVSALPVKFDLALLSRYENEVRYSFPAPSWLDTFNSKLHDTSLNRPENVAALVGQAVGGTGAPMLSAPAAFVGAGYTHDAKFRSRVWTELFLAGAQPTPLISLGMAHALRPEGDYLPLEKVREMVEEKLMENIAKRLIHDNLKLVDEELDRLTMESGDDLLQKDRAGQAGVLAATLGKAISATATGASPLSAAIDYSGAVTFDEKKARGREAATLVLGGTMPFINAAQVYQTETVAHTRARAYVAEAIKKYGLEHGTTTKPRDQYDIADDAGLASLKQTFDKPWNHMTTTKPKKFAQMFFPARENRQQMSMYKPQPMPPGNVRAERGFPDEWAISSTPTLYWPTSETPAYVPPYEEVKDRVLERWKLTKARDMARKDAEAIAAEINKSNSPDAGLRILRDSAAKIGSNIFYLDRVARLSAPMPPAVMSRQPNATGYDRYKVPEDKVEFPSSRFLSDMLGMAKPGEAKVLVDRPESTYYVAVLQSRSMPDFYTEFSRHDKALMDRMEQDAHPRERFREGVLAQLEKDAKLTIVDEQYEKDFAGSRRRGGGGDE